MRQCDLYCMMMVEHLRPYKMCISTCWTVDFIVWDLRVVFFFAQHRKTRSRLCIFIASKPTNMTTNMYFISYAFFDVYKCVVRRYGGSGLCPDIYLLTLSQSVSVCVYVCFIYRCFCSKRHK